MRTGGIPGCPEREGAVTSELSPHSSLPSILKGRSAKKISFFEYSTAFSQLTVSKTLAVSSSLLRTFPAKTLLWGASFAGWAFMGTLYNVVRSTRYVFGSRRAERVLAVGTDAAREIAERQLVSEEATLGGVTNRMQTVAGILPGGSTAVGMASAPILAADAASKKAQRVSLDILKGIITAGFGVFKKLSGSSSLHWVEDKLEGGKDICYAGRREPSWLAKKLSRIGDGFRARAWMCLHPSYSPRSGVPICSEREFDIFKNLSSKQKEAALERILSSNDWVVSEGESREFHKYLHRWSAQERHGEQHSLLDVKVMRTICSLFCHVSRFTEKKKTASDDDLEDFCSASIQDQNDVLFRAACSQTDRKTVNQYEQAVSRLRCSKDGRVSSTTDSRLLKAMIGCVQSLSDSFGEFYTYPDEFRQFGLYRQLRYIHLVKSYAPLDVVERRELSRLFHDPRSWKNLPDGRKEIVERMVLSHYNRLPKAIQDRVNDISSTGLMRFPHDVRVWFLMLLRDAVVDAEAKGVKAFVRRLLGRERRSAIVKSFMTLQISEDEFDDEHNIKEILSFINRQMLWGDKEYLRGRLDNLQGFYFMSKEQIEQWIAAVPSALADNEENRGQDRVFVTSFLQSVLREVQTVPVAPISEREFYKRYGLRDTELAPPQRADIPVTPAERIRKKIGPQIVSDGSMYGGFDLTGRLMGATLSSSIRAIAQLPRVTGWAADTTAGSTSIYCGIRGLAGLLRFLTSVQGVNDYCLSRVEETCQGLGFSWIDSVERRAAQLPQLGLRVAVPLQDSLIRGVDGVKSRLDSWTNEIDRLKKLRNEATTNGSADQLLTQLQEGNRRSHQLAQELQESVRLAATNAEGSQAQLLDGVAQLPASQIQEIFTGSPGIDEAIVHLRQAAIPQEIRAVAEERGGWGISSFFQSVLHVGGGALRGGEGGARGKVGGFGAVEGFNNSAKQLSESAQNILTLQRDFEVARSAQEQLEKASAFTRAIAESPGAALSTAYSRMIGPALDGAMRAWKAESALARGSLSIISSMESVQTSLSFGALDVARKAEGFIDSASGSVADGVEWLAEQVGEGIQERNREMAKARSRSFVDAVTSWLPAGLKAGVLLAGSVAARTLPMAAMRAGLGISSPVVVLGFLLNRAIPDALNAAAEPCSNHIGKALLGTYRGVAWTGDYLGSRCHKNMQEIGRFVQAAINRKMGWIDKKRILAFQSLSFDDQKYIYELVRGSTAVSEKMRGELKLYGRMYFEDISILGDHALSAFVETLLIGFNCLGPQDFLKITPAYFSALDSRMQQRIRQAVNRRYPRTIFNSDTALVNAFNALNASEREAINSLSEQEYLALSEGQRRDFCFHVLHSHAFMEENEISIAEMSHLVDPQRGGPKGKMLQKIYGFYPKVGEGELADLTPSELEKLGKARIWRVYQLINKYHPDWLERLAGAYRVTVEKIESVIASDLIGTEITRAKGKYIAGLASLFRRLPDEEKVEYLDMTEKEFTFMTAQERNVCLDCLLKLGIILQSELEQYVDAKESSVKNDFIERFNRLDPEVKAEIRQQMRVHSYQIFSLLDSCKEQLRVIDERLKQLHACAEVANDEKVKLSLLAERLDDDSANYSALRSSQKNAEVEASIAESEINHLLSARAHLKDFLESEGERVSSSPIEPRNSADPLTKSLSEMVIDGLVGSLCVALTLEELTAGYNQALESIDALIEKSSHLKGYKETLSQGKKRLDVAYEDRRNALGIPQKLSDKYESTRERSSKLLQEARTFSELEDERKRADEDVRRFAEKVGCKKEEKQLETLGLDLRSAYERRRKQLSASSHWTKVRGVVNSGLFHPVRAS